MQQGGSRLQVLVAIELSAAWQRRLQAEFPEAQFTFAQDPGTLMGAAPQAEVVLAHSFPREAVQAAERLRWLQAGTAGVSHLLYNEFRERGVILTNARAQGIPMAENVLGMIFAFATRLPLFIGSRSRREGGAWRAAREKFEVHGQTLVILGLGDVGSTLALKAASLGMRVLGVRRRPELPCPGAELVVGVDRLRDVLPQGQHVAMTLPLTQGTRHFLSWREFEWIRSGAYLYNVGGGATIDRQALLEALRTGRLAGAGLDVTDPDPLPPDDPLWEMENVILTQHTAPVSPHNLDRIAAIFAANLRRYLDGQPLLNVVDPFLGY